jgi:hypothetical protein
MPGARCTRGLVRKESGGCAHEHTGSAEAPGHPLRSGFTAYAVLSPATNSSCHRRLRIKVSPDPVGSVGLRRLGTSNGCRDHTVLPYANRLRQNSFAGHSPNSAELQRRRKRRSSCAPRDRSRGSSRPATTLAYRRFRVHHIPSRVRDDARSAPLVGTRRRELKR